MPRGRILIVLHAAVGEAAWRLATASTLEPAGVMVGVAVADGLSSPSPRRREIGLAALLAAAGLSILAVALRGHAGHGLPGGGDPALRAQSLHLLRLLTAGEGALFLSLAILLVRSGQWLQRQDVLALLGQRARLALAALVALHVASLLLYLPARELVSPEPIVTCDSAYHYYQVFAAHRILQHGGRLWGYDPYFMAGYPAGVVFDLDMKGAETFCHLLAGLGLPYAYKAYIALALLLFPIAIYGGARLLGLDRGSSVAALGLALLYWHWGRPLLGHFRWAGMHSYILASYLSVLAIALACRCLEASGRTRVACWAALVALVAVAVQVHPLAALHLAPGFLVLYVGAFRRLRPRAHAAVVLGLGLVFAANADWVLPSLRFLHYKTASNYWFQFRGARDAVILYTRETSILFTVITVLGVAGVVLLRRRKPLVAAALATSAACYFVAAFYGARFRLLAETEPGRYLVPFTFLLTLPAGFALRPLLERAQRRLGPPAVAVALVVLASATPLLALAENRFFDVHRVSARIDPRFHSLLGFLASATTGDARILFETPGGFYNSSSLFYGGHLQALVPIYTGREVIGGPYPVNFVLHAAVDFKNAELLGRPLREWRAEEFGGFLATYNIGWVVCWSASAQAYLDARPDMERLRQFDRFVVYAARRTPSWTIVGSARVRADYNRIEVSEARGDEIVLSYHWLESLRTVPPLPLDVYSVPGDPVGFVRVRPGGVSSFVIENAY